MPMTPYKKMYHTILLTLCLILMSSNSHSGNRMLKPDLREGSGYTSTVPEYHVIGIDSDAVQVRIWVVAPREQVLNPKAVNNIITSISRQLTDELRTVKRWEIVFYSTVHQQDGPAFNITELLAYYDAESNKTHFVKTAPGAEGWIIGPLQKTGDETAITDKPQPTQ